MTLSFSGYRSTGKLDWPQLQTARRNSWRNSSNAIYWAPNESTWSSGSAKTGYLQKRQMPTLWSKQRQSKFNFCLCDVITANTLETSQVSSISQVLSGFGRGTMRKIAEFAVKLQNFQYFGQEKELWASILHKLATKNNGHFAEISRKNQLMFGKRAYFGCRLSLFFGTQLRFLFLGTKLDNETNGQN